MAISAAESKLQIIPIDAIDRNPDNPRMVFRPGELEELLESIRVYDVQVPISVYREKGRYVLIDGERRYKCCLKLGRKTMPALVQQKPEPLQNLLLMFNIHALREQWDLLTIARKLPKIISLLGKELSRRPTEHEISERTGLNRGTIRRCKLLMDLPEEYQEEILDELRKPKSKQKITEDLFIELEKSLKTVERNMPEAMSGNKTVSAAQKDKVRQVLLKKFKNGTINNRVHFRLIAKIARARKVDVDPGLAQKQLEKLFDNNSYSIEAAFENSVGEAYKERDIGSRIDSLLGMLNDVDADELDEDVIAKLEKLVARARTLLGGAR